MSHRWLSSALHGRWCPNADAALSDALRAGQAIRESGPNDEITLRPFAWIQVR
jgi:hypothetical protein